MRFQFKCTLECGCSVATTSSSLSSLSFPPGSEELCRGLLLRYDEEGGTGSAACSLSVEDCDCCEAAVHYVVRTPVKEGEIDQMRAVERAGGRGGGKRMPFFRQNSLIRCCRSSSSTLAAAAAHTRGGKRGREEEGGRGAAVEGEQLPRASALHVDRRWRRRERQRGLFLDRRHTFRSGKQRAFNRSSVQRCLKLNRAMDGWSRFLSPLQRRRW